MTIWWQLLLSSQLQSANLEGESKEVRDLLHISLVDERSTVGL